MLPIFGSIRKLNSSQLADFCCKRRPQDYERIAAIGLDDLDVSAFEPGMQFAEAVARHLTSTEGHAEVGAGVSATAYMVAMPEMDHRTLGPRALTWRSTPADFRVPRLS